MLIKDDQLEEFNALGAALNLCPNNHVRLADNRAVSLSLPPSVELHQLPRSVAGYPKGTYLLNLSQVPPAWPVNPDSPLLAGGLYRFRPEFIANYYPGPVCAGDFNADRAQAAYKYLVEEQCARALQSLESLQELPLDSAEWTTFLHSQGINCCLLGKLAAAARLPHIKEALIVEMIARTAKRAIQSQLRGSILHFKELQALKVDDELRAIVLHTMATIVSTSTPVSMLGYVRELLEAVQYKFDFRVDLETFRRLARPALFLAIQHHSGLQFVDRVYDFSLEVPFAKEDFLMFLPTVDDISLPAGKTTTLAYSTFINNSNRETSTTAEVQSLTKLAGQVLPLGEVSWQYATKRAGIARQFLHLSTLHAHLNHASESSKFLDLAKSTVPANHPLRALIAVEQMRQRAAAFKATSSAALRELMAELKRQYLQAVAEVEAHLGPHHPLLISIHQEASGVFSSLSASVGGTSATGLQESLQARQNALAAAMKSLGRGHEWTREQVLKVSAKTSKHFLIIIILCRLEMLISSWV